MKEIWKDVVGYEGLYRVSNKGNIISLNAYHHGLIRPLKPRVNKCGYHTVSLRHNGKSIFTSVHIIVAKAFIPNPDNKPQVNHIDGNKSNNTVNNLEWVTSKENINHAINTGLRGRLTYIVPSGAANKNSKPIIQYDKNGDFVKKWDCQSDAARFYNCHPSRIINCAKGRDRSCKGFIWRYFDDPIPLKIEVPFNSKAPHKIVQKSPDGTIINEWNTYRAAAKEIGCNMSSVYCWCQGTQKPKNDYIWECVYL